MPSRTIPPRRIHPHVACAAALVLGTLLFAGCTSSDPPATDESDAPVTLRLSVQASAVESPYAVMADNYSDEHPNVTFEIEAVPNEQYGEVLRTQLRGGNAPDIFYTTGGSGIATSLLPLAEAGYVLPLTGTGADEILGEANRVLAEIDGQVYGQPLDYVPITNNYNATVAEDLGIELPFSDIADVFDACAVSAASGKPLLRLAGGSVPNNGLTTLQLAASRVYAEQPDWNELRSEGEVSFAATDGWRESLELIVELRDRGCFQDGVEAGAIADNVPSIAAGTVVGGFAPGGSIGDMSRVNPDNDFVATAFPGPSPGESRIFASTSNLFAINAASGEREQAAALDFLAWLGETENADKTASLSGNISVRAGAGASLPPQFQPVEEYFAESNFQPLASLLWPSPGVYDALGSGVQGLLTGQTTIDAVLAAMDAAWDAA